MSNIDYAFEVHKLLNRKKTSIACIIPAYNEGSRIGSVIETVINCPIFDEIILVNDGSSDNTLSVMKVFEKRNKPIKVIDIQPNGGKTNAVLKGFKEVKSELVCMIDADLKGLKYDYIYKMVYFVLNGEFDMTILDRAGDRMSVIGWANSWIARFLGGERAFWAKDFKKIRFGKNSKYAIEQEINVYYVENGLKVRTIYCSELNGEYQWNKKGLIPALESYAKMTIEIYNHSKTKSFYYQVESIVEDRIEPLYKLLKKTDIKAPVMGAILTAGLLTSIGSFLWLNLRKKVRRDN